MPDNIKPSSLSLQNFVLDGIVDGTVPTTGANSAPSLHPGPELAFACAVGNEVALEIAESWRFSFPITVMGSDEFDALSDSCHVVFTSAESR
jgi:hypothetical protein